MVMYMGQAMEVSDKTKLYRRPLHPYTNALMKSVPVPDPKLAAAARQDSWLTGDMPSPYRRPKGCIFHNRCPFRVKRCEADIPALRRMEDGDWVACHRAEELDLSIQVAASG
jgi:oligopeptide/dipeptide ABC transporter ATP-binding protein